MAITKKTCTTATITKLVSQMDRQLIIFDNQSTANFFLAGEGLDAASVTVDTGLKPGIYLPAGRQISFSFEQFAGALSNDWYGIQASGGDAAIVIHEFPRTH